MELPPIFDVSPAMLLVALWLLLNLAFVLVLGATAFLRRREPFSGGQEA